ncbi:uncharacterized protein LOC135214392 isoform X2 [Macrobrachium nipponense]
MDNTDENFGEGQPPSEEDLLYEQEEPLDYSMRRSPRETLSEDGTSLSRNVMIPRYQPVPVHSTTGIPMPSFSMDGMNQYLESNRRYLDASDYSADATSSPLGFPEEIEASEDSRRCAPSSESNRQPRFPEGLNHQQYPNGIFYPVTNRPLESDPTRQRNLSEDSSSDSEDNSFYDSVPRKCNQESRYRTVSGASVEDDNQSVSDGFNYQDLPSRNFGQRMHAHLQNRNRTLSGDNQGSEYPPPSETLPGQQANGSTSSSSPPLSLDAPPMLGEDAMAAVHRYMIQCMSRHGAVSSQYYTTLNLYETLLAQRQQDSSQTSGPMSVPSTSQAVLSMPPTGQGALSFHSASQGPMSFPSTSQGPLNFASTSQGALSMPSSSQGPISFPSSSQGPLNFSTTGQGPLSLPPPTSQGAMGFPSAIQGPISFPSTSQGAMSFPSTSAGMGMAPPHPGMQQQVLSLMQAASFLSPDGSLEKSQGYIQFRQHYLRRRNMSTKPRRGNRDRSSDAQESGQDGHGRRDLDEASGLENGGAEGGDRLGEPGSRDDENNNGGMRLDKNGQPRDAAYWERRKRNNQAAKRSRDAKRNRELENEIQLEYLKWLLLPNLYRLMGLGNNNRQQ